MKEFLNNIREFLKENENIKKADFARKICNTNKIIYGLKKSQINSLTKNIKDNIIELLENLDQNIFEEQIIYSNLLEKLKNTTFIKYLINLLNYTDSWAIVDNIKCRDIKINQDNYLNLINKLIDSNKEYFTRTGFLFLMKYYLEEKYLELIIGKIKENKSCTHYYVNMMIAWLLQNMFLKFPEKVFILLKSNDLNLFVKRKIISKLIDSYRVLKSEKDKLKKIRETYK